MAEPTEREKRIAARKAALAARMPRTPPVRVEPRDDDVRRYIKHPRGPRFPESGPAEWPFDRFTRRRIADGAVKIVTETSASPSSSPRPHRRAPHADTAAS